MWNRYVWEIPYSEVNFFLPKRVFDVPPTDGRGEKGKKNNWKKKRINLFPTLASAFVCCSIPQGIISQKNIQNLSFVVFLPLFLSQIRDVTEEVLFPGFFVLSFFFIFLLRERNCLSFFGRADSAAYSAFNKQGRRERKSKDFCTVFGSRGNKVGIFWCLSFILPLLLWMLSSMFRRKDNFVQF